MKRSVHGALAERLRLEGGALAQRLRRERDALLEGIAHLEADLQSIAQERESELEERAQEERAGQLSLNLQERDRREIEEIDTALRRIADGSYGICTGCGRRIPWGRLRALPRTHHCVGCAREEEDAREAGAVQRRENRSEARGPEDGRLLTDRELTTLLREHVRADGRVDMEELRIICRHGVAFLDGALPSADEYQILLKLVRDVVGVEDVVDRLQVERLLWEREDRPGRKTPRELRSRLEPGDTEDVLESVEEELDYVPPLSPPPDG